jgi:hypothetical protein
MDTEQRMLIPALAPPNLMRALDPQLLIAVNKDHFLAGMSR